jgi:phosphoglucosamine mutase
MKLFGSSGIRQVVTSDFLHLMFQVGLAMGNSCQPVVIGCDTRTSSEAVKYSFISGLLAGGASAADAGALPTPTLAFSAREFDAGAMITASHNPPQYNGIKLVNPDGSAFDSVQRKQIEEKISGKSFALAPWQKMKNCIDYTGAVDRHIARIQKDFPGEYGLRVVVDCGGGAASVITPQLLSKLGCKVIPLYCEPTGQFPREIEPLPENLGELIQTVKSKKADLGIAHDGDADRIAVIDGKGRFVSADKLIALFARELGVRIIVTTVDASMVIDELGFEVVRTRVGDAFVSDELRAESYENARAFGAEPSGCYIFPRVSLCPDGIYAAAKIIEIASKRKLSALVDEIPSYPVLRGSVAGDRSAMKTVEHKLKAEAEGSLATIDGLRLAFRDGWLLIRPSGTEPKIRITAEARSRKKAKEIFEFGIKTVKDAVHR